MSAADVIIRFDGVDSDYAPGDTLSGEYRVNGIAADQVAAIEVSVVWYTEGKGDQDMAVHEFWRNDFDRGAVDVGLTSQPAATWGEPVVMIHCTRGSARRSRAGRAGRARVSCCTSRSSRSTTPSAVRGSRPG